MTTLTQDQINNILKSAFDLIESEFYEYDEIHRQTGLNDERCKEMASDFALLRSYFVKKNTSACY
jgi:hypothetical protein